MIAVTIGRIFLNAWNKEYNKNYSAKEFFVNEFFPLFFDHPQYLLWIQNSPFVQMKKGQKVELITHEERQEKLTILHGKIDEGVRDASIAIGFPASEEKEFATTSGMVSDIDIKIETEDVYYSWIGGGLGVGVSGGYSIFFSHPQILLSLYKGWKVYRKHLNNSAVNNMPGNKINTWNGQWLSYSFSSKVYEEDPDFSSLFTFFKQKTKPLEFQTIFWGKLYFSLSKKLSDEPLCAYSLGQTNKTLGFMPVYLQAATGLIKIYETLFGKNEAISNAKVYENLFGIHIKRACELGALGLQALEPNGLRDYFGDKKPVFSFSKIAQKKDETNEAYEERKRKSLSKEYESIITFRTYKTWLLAMITKNKEEDLHYSEKVAKALIEYKNGDNSLSTLRSNMVKNILNSNIRKTFLENLPAIIKNADDSVIDLFKDLQKKVYLMTKEEFGYFIVLLKIDFAYLERK